MMKVLKVFTRRKKKKEIRYLEKRGENDNCENIQSLGKKVLEMEAIHYNFSTTAKKILIYFCDNFFFKNPNNVEAY